MSAASDPSRRTCAAVGTVAFFFLAPETVAGLVPWWITRWHAHRPFPGYGVVQFAGAVLMAAGLVVLADSFVRFAAEGLGTPAPVFPTKHLVVRGFYRRVRNPMYVAVLALIIGQAGVFGSLRLLAYAAGAWLITDLFVRCYEEPVLRRMFGPEYAAYCRRVNRWLPRITAAKADSPR